jgi:hypothetical protein
MPRWEELQMEGIEMEEMGGVVEGMRVVDGRTITCDENTLRIECGERNGRLKDKK